MTFHARDMIADHPDVKGNTNNALIACIEECYSCAQTCSACADACLAEDGVQMLRQCIRLDMDCADICYTTGVVSSRRTGSNEASIQHMLRACIDSCARCAEECDRHAGKHDHCRICAEACRACAQACREALATF